MKSRFIRYCVFCVYVLVAAKAQAQPPPAEPPAPAADPTPLPAPAPEPPAAPTPAEHPQARPSEEPERAPEKLFDTRVYGFINAFLDTIPPLSSEQPRLYDRATDKVIKSQPPLNYNVDAFVMIQGTIGSRYRYYVNVAALGAGDPIASTAVELRNSWVEASIFGQALAVRAGRMYRRFGLYNEILDATPTFMGTREPEILDADHLMITRTTNLMLLGVYVKDVHKIEYSLTTGRDERESDQIPLGADVNYNYQHSLKIGISYYDSLGKATPGVAVGSGSPKGGVADWMAEDKYRVVDAYAQIVKGPWIAQLEYCIARHHAKRDIAATLQLADPAASLSPAQYRRFFTDPFDDVAPTEADVIRRAAYTAQTAYFRLGYELRDGRYTPYVQGDFYQNPEMVPLRPLGGDQEAGYDDRGHFLKGTLGFMFRPIPQVALKLEYGSHLLVKWAGTSYLDPELRASFSYLWEL